MTREFEGRTAIVTGGGAGIGRATALRLASLGASVVIADIHAETANDVVAEITTQGGIAVAVIGDLSDQAVVDGLVSTAIDTFGSIDVLINNAGIMDDMSGPHEVSDTVWDRVIRINLTAPFLLTRAVVPHMLAKGKGAIVNTASEAGIREARLARPTRCPSTGSSDSRNLRPSSTATREFESTRLHRAASPQASKSM